VDFWQHKNITQEVLTGFETCQNWLDCISGELNKVWN